MSSEHGGELAELLGQGNAAEIGSHRVRSCRWWRAFGTWLAVSLLGIGTTAWAVSGRRMHLLASMFGPHEDIEAFSKHKGWRHHPGLNCFSDHGGVPLSGPAQLPGAWSVEGCLEQCDKAHACHAAVVSNSVPDGQSPCFLLDHITESECLQGMPYDTWSRKHSETPEGGLARRNIDTSPPASTSRAPGATTPDSKVATTNTTTTGGASKRSHYQVRDVRLSKNEIEEMAATHAEHKMTAASEHADPESPNWGCGLLGFIPGISEGGKQVTKETQQLIDALKATSDFGKVSYWNWNFAPQTNNVNGKDETEVISSDFLFMPEMWGAGVAEDKYIRPAGQSNFLDSNGQQCAATMANILLGTNEPDIGGSCMGNMFGTCLAPCPASMTPAECPAAHLDDRLPRASPTASGQCNCWQFSHATGAGFWPLKGCAAEQPLPKLWDDPACVGAVMGNWKQTAAIAVAKGYKYLSTPLIAENMDYAEKFIQKACGCTTPDSCSCTEASCGCPVYVGFHFYAYDCQPSGPGGYNTFKSRLQAVADIMDKYKFVKGAIINEVGMLNCASEDQNPICVPDSGKYPASKVKDHSCPSNHDLPDGLSTFVKQLFRYVADARTKDDREVVKGFSWFNQDRQGGTYNLRLFDSDGSLNKVGRSYMEACTEWRRPTTT
eukprot:TRINITY_DN11518_c0_g1_i1.p1 TRINITY_DN11518_c0_g1~~TRINITY_DN11518_c0_g1_i1.p1  ORF type:complete len:664 (+),score=101.98 TRINITY_DN11518_c0_g1_i1:83-2074(+)